MVAEENPVIYSNEANLVCYKRAALGISFICDNGNKVLQGVLEQRQMSFFKHSWKGQIRFR